MGRLSVVAALAAALIVGFGGPAFSASEVDQEQPNDTAQFLAVNSPETPLAQTFTAGEPGLLDRVDVRLTGSAGPGDIVVQLTGVSGTDPSSTVLASATLPASTLPTSDFAWVEVHFDAPAEVTAGDQYAIVLRSEGAATGWVVNGPGGYSAGAIRGFYSGAWHDPYPASADFAFKTYVGTAYTTAPTATITGTARSGQTLTAHEGTPDPTPDSYEYQWFADGVEISGATNNTFALTDAQVGAKVTVKVTAKKAGFIDSSDTSDPTVTVTGIFDPGPTATITGTARIGSTLTAHAGPVSPTPDKISYRWFADGKQIADATASTFKLTKSQVGKKITVRIYVAKAGYPTVNDLSDPTGFVSGLTAKRLNLEPDQDTVRVGQTVYPVEISGLSGGEKWTLYFDGTALKTGNADSKGKVKTSYVVPSAPKGKHVLKVTGRFSDRYDTDTLAIK